MLCAGIGTNWPNTGAALDIVDGNKGVLLPKAPLLNLTGNAMIALPANGLLQYNTPGELEGGTTLNKKFPVRNISIDVKPSAGEQVYVSGNRNTPGAVALSGCQGIHFL